MRIVSEMINHKDTEICVEEARRLATVTDGAGRIIY